MSKPSHLAYITLDNDGLLQVIAEGTFDECIKFGEDYTSGNDKVVSVVTVTEFCAKVNKLS